MGECDIERFIFPDGTERDMLVFDTAARPAPCPVSPPPGDTRDPHLCPVCGSTLVHPTEWQRIAVAAWRITLRCPNCETVRTGVFDRGQVERLNRALYEGTERLAREAEQLVRHNFEEEVDKFVAALDADLIMPIDV